MAFALSAYKSIMQTLYLTVIFLQYPYGELNCFVVLNGEFNDLIGCNGLLSCRNTHAGLQSRCDVTFSLHEAVSAAISTSTPQQLSGDFFFQNKIKFYSLLFFYF